jgi:Tol biopolymer transport system component
LGHPASDYKPFWSPDGKQIAFTSNRDYVTGDSLRYRTDLYIINADGTELERITENGKAMNPIWSNAGNQNIIFVRFRHFFDGFESGIYSVNKQTGELVLIQKDPSENIFLFPYALSPDGTQLVTLAEQRYSPWNSTIYLIDIEQNSMTEVFSENSSNANAKTYGLDWYFYEE